MLASTFRILALANGLALLVVSAVVYFLLLA
jgi:hypothetical protein